MNKTSDVFGQALSAHRAGQLEQAIALYRQVLALDGAHAAAHHGLGLAHFALGQYSEARAGLEAAIKIDPSYAEAFHGLGLVEKSWGHYGEALEHFRQARRLRPEFVDAIAGEAGMLETTGQLQAAYDMLTPLVEKNIVNTNLAVAYAKVAGHFGDTDGAREALRRALEAPNLGHADRIVLHFELGRILDSMGRYDEAFAQYREGNRQQHARFNPEQNSTLVNEIIRAFGENGLPGHARAGNVSDLPVFIVGMPRSGTSLVESILAAHPRVYGAGELDFFGMFCRALPPATLVGRSLSQLIPALDAATLDRVAAEYLPMLRRLGGETVVRVTDKLPYNFFWLGLLALLFPGARVIHCRRDPRDTCLSIYFQNFTGQHHYAYDLRNIGLYYRDYARLMDHWRSVGTLPMLEVQYEQLVRSPDTQQPRIVEFCGLPWDDACARFYAAGRVTRTASYDQVRRPIYDSSIGRWRHYERHLAPLIGCLGDIV